jgi:CDP-glycerol glycerophosphotransferase (TagB/SpsB family)
MPTWRDSSRGGVDKALPDYERLSQSLRNTSSVLIIKSHHNETFDAVDFPDNIFLWDNSIDIYPILHKFDVLITDYSSILYDFLALEKRDIILYIYDMEDYLRYSRSLAFPFDENTVGVIAKSFEDLCEILKKPLVRDIDKCSRIMGKFWEHTERGCEDIHWEIVRRISNV